MPGSPADVKLVSNAMANATRRKIMAKLVESSSTNEEIAKVAGASMLDYHLQILQQAGLAEIKENTISLTEFGKNFMESKDEKPAEFKKDLAGNEAPGGYGNQAALALHCRYIQVQDNCQDGAASGRGPQTS